MIHYFYGTLQVGIGQTLCSFEHVSCLNIFLTACLACSQVGLARICIGGGQDKWSAEGAQTERPKATTVYAVRLVLI